MIVASRLPPETQPKSLSPTLRLFQFTATWSSYAVASKDSDTQRALVPESGHVPKVRFCRASPLSESKQETRAPDENYAP